MTTTTPDSVGEGLLPPSSPEGKTVESFWKDGNEECKDEGCDAAGKPLLPAPGAVHETMTAKTEAAEPESEKQVLLIAFFFLGAGSEIVWGALMLCVGTLAEAYGPTVMSTMASVQNNSRLWTMVFFTVIPRPASNKVTLALLMMATLAMLALAIVLARTLLIGTSALPSEHYFLIAIGANGVCTGMVQILAASLSGLFSKLNTAVPGALLLGVTGGPLLLATFSLLLPALGVDPSQTSFVTLSTAAVILGLALLGLARLSCEQAPPTVVTCGSYNSDGGKNKEYVCRRLSEMGANAGLMLTTVFFGIIVLCSVPYGVPHVCGGDADCMANLPRLMVASCAVSSFVGRFLAMLRGAERDIKGIGVSVFLRACFAGTLAWSYSSGRFPDGVSGQVGAVAGIAIVTIWGNGLTIDLSRESQRACGQSLIFPCPITAQITWISLQSGMLLGSLASFFFK